MPAFCARVRRVLERRTSLQGRFLTFATGWEQSILAPHSLGQGVSPVGIEADLLLHALNHDGVRRGRLKPHGTGLTILG